jgi:hypothetical protein
VDSTIDKGAANASTEALHRIGQLIMGSHIRDMV